MADVRNLATGRGSNNNKFCKVFTFTVRCTRMSQIVFLVSDAKNTRND